MAGKTGSGVKTIDSRSQSNARYCERTTRGLRQEIQPLHDLKAELDMAITAPKTHGGGWNVSKARERANRGEEFLATRTNEY